jgi:hypothetical protein
MTPFLIWSGEHPILSLCWCGVLCTAAVAIIEQIFNGVAAIIRAFRN